MFEGLPKPPFFDQNIRECLLCKGPPPNVTFDEDMQVCNPSRPSSHTFPSSPCSDH